MKMKLAFGVAVCAALGLSAVHANAAAFSNEDVILCFESLSTGPTGATTDLEIDLGNFATLNNLTSGQVNLGSILSSTYGSSWDTDGDISWELLGANTTSTTTGGLTKYSILASADSSADQVGPLDSGDEQPPASDIAAIYQAVGGTAVGNGLTGVTISNSLTDSFTYQNDTGNNNNPIGNWGGLETTANGTTSMDLWKAQSNGTEADLGTFTLSSSGVFTAPAAVPEPSTWATMIVGAACLLGFRRSRLARKA